MSSSQGMAVVTAMVAFSGTVIFLSLCLQKSLSSQHHPTHFSPPSPRSCISSDGKKKKEKKMKKTEKKVHFAEDVVDRIENGEEFGRRSSSSSPKVNKSGRGRSEIELPANRLALYNGILRDRLVLKLAYSY